MRVVFVLLLIGVIAGYAAVSSPELRGPFATPRPSAVIAPTVATPAVQLIQLPVERIEIPSRPVSCVQPSPVPVFVDVRGVSTAVGGELVSQLVPVSAGNDPQCSVWWGQPPNLKLPGRTGR